jgi:hypothetical protein
MKASRSVACIYCFTLVFSLFFSTSSINAQDGCKDILDKSTGKKVYSKYDIAPKYKNGIVAMQKFVITNFNSSKNDPWQSTYSIVFVIDTDGSVIAPRIQNKPVAEYSSGERELIRVFLQMPRWDPGRCSETIVPCLVTTPIIMDPSVE